MGFLPHTCELYILHTAVLLGTECFIAWRRFELLQTMGHPHTYVCAVRMYLQIVEDNQLTMSHTTVAM